MILGLGALLLLRPGAQLPPTPVPSAAASPGAGELVLADSLANPASAVFPREQSGTGQATFSNGDSATYPWDFAYMYSAIVAHVLGPYPANPDSAWLAASATLDQSPPHDFAVQVRARVTRSPEASAFGLGFESDSAAQYLFYVTPADQTFRLQLPQGQGAPVSGRTAWILPPTQPNLLRLEMRGGNLRILINGHELVREAPPGLAARQDGKVSLRWAMTTAPSDGGSVEVRFAQFALYTLP